MTQPPCGFGDSGPPPGNAANLNLLDLSRREASDDQRENAQAVHVEPQHVGKGAGAFYLHHPPSDDLISDCVNCGF